MVARLFLIIMVHHCFINRIISHCVPDAARMHAAERGTTSLAGGAGVGSGASVDGHAPIRILVACIMLTWRHVSSADSAPSRAAAPTCVICMLIGGAWYAVGARA